MDLALLTDVSAKLLLAVALAGVLGLERELKGHAAGLRTHVLVCLGATLAMIISEVLADEFNRQGQAVWLDKGRMAAGVITGVGFLGAGAIINVGSENKGLTTAALIWFAATLGIAIGVGQFMIAFCATGFALVTVVGLQFVERLLPVSTSGVLRIETTGATLDIEATAAMIRAAGIEIAQTKIALEKSQVDITFIVQATRGAEQLEVLIGRIRDSLGDSTRITYEGG